MNSKKIGEIVGTILFALLAIGLYGWMFLTVSKLPTSGGTASVTLADIPLSQIKKSEKTTLITLKNLLRFGNIPVTVSGGERTKSNLFLPDQGPTERGVLKYDNFNVSYPQAWWKQINKDNTISLNSPLNSEIISPASVLVKFQEGSVTSNQELEKLLQNTLFSIYGISSKNTDQMIVESSSNGSIKARVPFSVQSGGIEKKGWIGGITHSSPTKTATSKIYDLIISNKSSSSYLREISANLMNSPESISALLKDDILVQELKHLGQEITYTTPPYSGTVLLIFESSADKYSDFEADARSIFDQVTFNESIAGKAVE